MKVVTCLTVALLAMAGFAPNSDSGSPPSSQPASESWHQVKSASGTVKTDAKLVKFKVGTSTWRLKLTTTPGEVNPASSTARVALMVEALRDINDNPANWTQVEVLAEGKAGREVTREYDNGLDKNGEPKWFALSVLGYGAKYELVVEDQSAPPKKGKKKD